MHKRIFFAAICLAAVPGSAVLYAQWPGLSGLDPFRSERGGLHLYNVTASSTYYSVGLPNAFGLMPDGLNLKSDVALGASASVGWIRYRPDSSIAIAYTPSYIGRLRYTGWNAFDHSLSISASRAFGQKWRTQLSANAGVNTMDNFLFTPTLLSTVASVPTTLDDLASAVLAGKYTNNQLASMLTGAPVVESPARTLLYGYRGLSSGVVGSVSYAPSTRLTVTVGVGASRYQHLSSSADAGYNFLVPHMTSGTANLSLSYSLSPRTSVGATLSSSRVYSRVQNAYTHSGSAFIGRTMGRRWFAQLHAGAGIYDVISTVYALPPGPQYMAGGSLAYKTFAHTFMGAYDRTLGSTSGWGAGSTTNVTGTWNWRRPGREWGLFTSVGWQRMDAYIWKQTDAWRGTAGLVRGMGSHTALQLAYSYMSYSAGPNATPYSLAQSAVRVAVVWSPHPVFASR